MRRFWRDKYDIFNFCGVYHKSPPLQPEDVQRIAETGLRHSFRFLSVDNDPKVSEPSRRKIPDLPGGADGLLMNLRAAEILLPLVSPWTTIQGDVEVDGKSSHILAIVTQTYDAVNEPTSLGARGARSGIWLDVKELHLRDAQIGPSPIFRVPTSGITP